MTADLTPGLFATGGGHGSPVSRSQPLAAPAPLVVGPPGPLLGPAPPMPPDALPVVVSPLVDEVAVSEPLPQALSEKMRVEPKAKPKERVEYFMTW